MFVADVKCPQATWQTVRNSRAGNTKNSTIIVSLKLEKLVVRRWKCMCIVKVHGKIYVVGGRNNSPDAAHQDSPAVDCFDPRSNSWTRCADMMVSRNRVGVAALDCLVYAVGGSDRETHHNSVERYTITIHSLFVHLCLLNKNKQHMS